MTLKRSLRISPEQVALTATTGGSVGSGEACVAPPGLSEAVPGGGLWRSQSVISDAVWESFQGNGPHEDVVYGILISSLKAV